VKYFKEIGLLILFENTTKLAEVPSNYICGRHRAEIRFVCKLRDAINAETLFINQFMNVLQCFTYDHRSNHTSTLPSSYRP
jgi:hypothetical protein